MSKIKKLFAVILLTVAAVCISFAVASCSDTSGKFSGFPDVRQPAGYIPPEDEDNESLEYNGKYYISVQSVGGMNLNGVRVSAVKNGVSVMDGISINGLIEFPLEAGVYELRVEESSLPAGYFIPEGETFATVANLARAKITLSSKVIPQTAPSGNGYLVGDVMYDFSFTDTDGLRYTLSELLEIKKAVVLNFWYTSCNPCRTEFPAIQRAYEAYQDKVAIVAIDKDDSLSEITKFKQDYSLTFHMCYDSAGVNPMFSSMISGYPTTVVIDRYGVVAYSTSGSMPTDTVWKALFNSYTSDNYVQSTEEQEVPEDRPLCPDGYVMSSQEEIAAAINGVGTQGKVLSYYEETNEKDKPYSWPWIVTADETGSYLTASNSMAAYSYAIVYSEITLTTGDVLSYEYRVDTEADADILYSLINGEIVGTHSGESEGWQQANGVYVANHDVTIVLSFIYIKDQAENVGTDTASIRNINIRHVSEMGDVTFDLLTSVIVDLDFEDGKYKVGQYDFDDSTFGNLWLNTKDNYYYVTYTNSNGQKKDSLLLMDMLNVTYWTEKHLVSTQFYTVESSLKTASLYNLSFWLLSNYEQSINYENIELDFGYYDSECIIDSYYLQEFSDCELLPVTPARMEMMKEFIKAMYAQQPSMFVDGDEYYEDQWLELCFYYMHYGLEDSEDHVCFGTTDPIKALTYENAFTAELGYNSVSITKIINLGDGGGVKYLFTPATTGVYFFWSDSSSIDIDPKLYIYDPDGTLIVECDNDMRYTGVSNYVRQNFYSYAYLEAGKTYLVNAAMSFFQETGDYGFYIQYAGRYIEQLELCATGEGVYVPDETGANRYEAIPVALNPTDKYYHAVTEDYDYGSVIYIDFLHANFFDMNGHTLLWMVQNGYFNFGAGMDFTAQMQSYYEKSIAGKSEDDKFYGLIEADQTIVNMLNAIVLTYQDEGPTARAWLAFACYMVTYGTPD